MMPIPNSAGHVQPQAVEAQSDMVTTESYAEPYNVQSADMGTDGQMIGNTQSETPSVRTSSVSVSQPVLGASNPGDAVIMPPVATASASTLPPAKSVAKSTDPVSGVAADTRAVFQPTAPVATATAATAVPSNTATVANSAATANTAKVVNQATAAAKPVPRSQGGSALANYAKSSEHPVGTKKYSRGFLSKMFKANQCNDFSSPEKAQAAFLAQGGPQNDSMGLDPDGDGYACAWDPAPYRYATNG